MSTDIFSVDLGFDSPHLHHPSLASGELRMACHPYPSEGKGKDVLRSSMSGGGQIITEKRKNRIMFYTYILRSINHPDQRYIGSTAVLRKRIAAHNAGRVPHTAKYRPWKIETYIAVETEERARAFEIYLKSGSGHAFAKRHF